MMTSTRFSLLILVGNVATAGAAELEPRRSWEAHGKGAFHSGIFDLAYSRDGKVIATGGGDGTVALWDAASGKLIRRMTSHPTQVDDLIVPGVFSLAFSPDGKLLVSGGGDDRPKVWDVRSGQVRRVLGKTIHSIRAAAWSPDGRFVASVGQDEGVQEVVWLFDAGRGGPPTELRGPEQGIESLRFSPSSKTLVAGDQQGGLVFYDLTRGREPRRVAWNKDWIYALAFSPDGKTLACTGGEDGSIRLVDPATGRQSGTIEGDGTVFGLSFSPDGKLLASAVRLGECRLIDVATRRVVARLSEPAEHQWAVAFSPDGKTVALGGGGNTVRLYDVPRTP